MAMIYTVRASPVCLLTRLPSAPVWDVPSQDGSGPDRLGSARADCLTTPRVAWM